MKTKRITMWFYGWRYGDGTQYLALAVILILVIWLAFITTNLAEWIGIKSLVEMHERGVAARASACAAKGGHMVDFRIGRGSLPSCEGSIAVE